MTGTPERGERLLADQRARWARGERVSAEEYLRAEPSLSSEIVLDLLYNEVVLRQDRGELPALGEYQARFPELSEDLRLMFEVDEALGSGPAAPVPPSLPGYELGEMLGRGGMGVVYRARQLASGREVAVKVLPRDLLVDAESVARFGREARAKSQLDHPNVCAFYELGEHEGQPFIVMERVEGRTLRSFTGSALPSDDLVPLVRQIAAALRAAHAVGIVHRDIKPENVMVRDDGCVKVLDFGLARLLPTSTSAPPPSQLTRTGTLLGTLRYMSPEQLRGEPVGSPSDVFSLGVLWHELATGRHPFEAAPAGVPLATFDLPPRLEALMRRMLANDPELRPTIDSVIAALDEGATETGTGERRLIGREAELAELWAAFEEVAAGTGQLRALTGEAGVGKTALADQFLAELGRSGRVAALARARCVEGSSAITGVLESLLRGRNANARAQIMNRVAPTWYARCARRSAPSQAGVPPEKEWSELAALFDELVRLGPAALFLDDAHRADAASLALVAKLGERSAAMPLLILVSHRPPMLPLAISDSAARFRSIALTRSS
jgi:serine/threonine-protein kinase